MEKFPYNPEHHHDREGTLFTVRRVREETFWETLTPATTDLNEVYVRVYDFPLSARKYYYVELEELMRAWYAEGLFSSTIVSQIDGITQAYIEFCDRNSITIPTQWAIKRPDLIEIPWTMALAMFRPTITVNLRRKGYSRDQINAVFHNAANTKDPELYKLVKDQIDQWE